jgi:hypothetical protein
MFSHLEHSAHSMNNFATKTQEVGPRCYKLSIGSFQMHCVHCNQCDPMSFWKKKSPILFKKYFVIYFSQTHTMTQHFNLWHSTAMSMWRPKIFSPLRDSNPGASVIEAEFAEIFGQNFWPNFFCQHRCITFTVRREIKSRQGIWRLLFM